MTSERPRDPDSAPRTSRGQMLLDAAIELSRSGDLERAIDGFDAAMNWAIEQGESDLWDRAFCGRCAISIELGERDLLSELRQIVLRSTSQENGFLAAYNIARAYELDRDHERALFYARIARDRCQSLQRRDWMAWSSNQTGNLLLAESQFEEACSEYELALQLMPHESTVDRALLLDNLGYCRIVQGRIDEGFSLLQTSLRTIIRHGAERFQAGPRLSLCYAYLDVGRHAPALRHGLRALDIAQRASDDNAIKYAHFLLGETYNQLGEGDIARGYFTRLQQRYFPGADHVPELLLAVDVRPLINLKA